MRYYLFVVFYSLTLSCSTSSILYAIDLDPANWRQIIGTVRHIRDVQMLDFNTIIAVGGNRTNDAITTVLRTTDRGAHWDIIIDKPHSPWLQAVYFPNPTIGFAAGHDGMVLRTTDVGISWDTLQLPGNAALRDYNGVHFTSVTTGFLVGGQQANDSIRTILKTTDGGNSWQIVKDELGPWLNAVHFVSSTVGFASGASGTILKTVDGGDTWTDISLQGNLSNRHYNAIRFSDAMNGIAVGGNLTNDSIRTIIRTQDGGSSWQSILDNVASWLNDIDILPSGMMIAVGNDSTILRSEDGGDTWEKVIIPTAINWAVNLNAVDFIYGGLGIVVGDYGQMLLYEGFVPNAPLITVNAATIASTDSILISGTVKANGSNVDVYFDYGPTQALGFTIDATPNMVSGPDSVYVEALITGLSSGIYYYRLRAVNEIEEVYTDLRQFYIGNFYDDLNLDFEQWNEMTFNLPDNWMTYGQVHSSPSYNGTLAVTLEGDADEPVGAMVLGNLFGGQISGGIPIASTPDSIVGHFNYEITPGTQGIVLLILKKDGGLLNSEYFPITGSSGGSFERLAFAVAYAGIEAPDTMLLAVGNNQYEETAILSPDNVVRVDDLQIISTPSVNIPNGDFENWEDMEATHPANWYSSDMEERPMLNNTVFRTEEAQHGSYALTLRNRLNYNESGSLYTSNANYDKRTKFPVVGRHTTFNGYYKYEMLGDLDTVDISVQLYLNSVVVGGGSVRIGTTTPLYTPFEIELWYNPPTVVPDSAGIQIRMGNDSLPGPSVLYLDNFSFDGFIVPYEPLITAIEEVSTEPSDFIVYPNPTDGMVWIASASGAPISRVEVYDLSGALVKQGIFNAGNARIDMNHHPAGIYLLQIFSADGAQPQMRKLVRY